MKININEQISVTLTKDGEKIWFLSNHSGNGYDPKTKILKEQFWVIMAVFGNKFYCGAPCYFEQNEIDVKDE